MKTIYKLICAIIVVSILGIPVSASRLTGDVNDDGTITVADSLLYLRYSVGQDISPYHIDTSDDVTCDSTITVADALIVLRKSVGQTVDLICDTPPGSITNLHNTSYLPDSITWTWTDPGDADFDHVDVYINGIFKGNVPKGDESYSATGLKSDTTYEIGTHTVDVSGNINETWKNDTARTAPVEDKTPPGSITNLHNTSYLPDSITWTWSDPGDADFDHVDVYINGIFKGNVPKGDESYSATGLKPD
ncbi:MAG: dockerin type I domain-containing protein, partial [Candidatus Methanoperedens sp.]|nr:dockerin type I domain-containing protein [Candidatus Methanoperedens sp.]